MLVDAIYRFLKGISHLYGYLKFKDIPIPPVEPDAVRIATNLWPSHIMFFIEMILIILVIRLFMQKNNIVAESCS